MTHGPEREIIIPSSLPNFGKPEQMVISDLQISKAVYFLAQDIARDYRDKDPILVGILKGCQPLMSDLARALARRGRPGLRQDYMMLASYGNTTQSSGDVKILLDLGFSIGGEDVIVIEDIYDEGHTLLKAHQMLKSRSPASLKYVVLVEKEGDLKAEMVDIDYSWFNVQERPWLEGYGMDTEERGRGRPNIIARKLPETS